MKYQAKKENHNGNGVAVKMLMTAISMAKRNG